MRVVSELADLEFQVGAISRRGDELIIDSAADSTLASRIRIRPREALATLLRLAASGAAWGFLLRLPFALLRDRRDAADDRAWRERRERIGLNKPW